ncbi:MAG: DUF2333 family protein [Anaerobiospirillum sp.]|nr:DUF2333 family protein [Anaerobiospirillum sp.]
MDKVKLVKYGLGTIVGLVVVWVLAIGLISSANTTAYRPEPLPATDTDQERAQIIARGLTYALDDTLSSTFGFLPNDLIAPWILDNTPYYQRGVVYATRPASEVISQEVGRYGNRDTVDPRLADATSRYFSYSEFAWGFLFVYDAEGKYRAGIQNWANWAQSVGLEGKQGAVFNLRSDDIYAIVKYCVAMTDYALGVLNNDKMGHFSTDNNVYYAKGICAVVGNVLRALVAVDSTLSERGGAENLQEALKRLDYIAEFNPIYVMAGGNTVGDAMMPNHVAALARHIDVTNNRLNDMLQSMTR